MLLPCVYFHILPDRLTIPYLPISRYPHIPEPHALNLRSSSLYLPLATTSAAIQHDDMQATKIAIMVKEAKKVAKKVPGLDAIVEPANQLVARWRHLANAAVDSMELHEEELPIGSGPETESLVWDPRECCVAPLLQGLDSPEVVGTLIWILSNPDTEDDHAAIAYAMA